MATVDGRGMGRIVTVSILVGVLVSGGWLIGTTITAHASTSAQQGTLLPYDTVVRGQISESANEEYWRFNGQAGDLILIDMRAITAGLDASLTLMAPDGGQLISDDDGGPGFNARIGPFELPTNGEYSILAGHYSGQGEYTLDLRNLRTIPALAPGKPLLGSVSAEQPNNVFALELPPGDTLWQLAITSDQASPIIALYDTERFISSTENSPDSSTLDPIIPVPGKTYIAIVSWDAGPSSGEYDIALRESTLELLTDGASQAGTLDTMTPNQTHYFRGEEGQTVQITIRTLDDIAPALEIRSVDYSAFLYFSEGEHTREIRVTLAIPVTGVYAIHVRDGSFTGNRGDYTLDFEVVSE